jgi:hypothetical protein
MSTERPAFAAHGGVLNHLCIKQKSRPAGVGFSKYLCLINLFQYLIKLIHEALTTQALRYHISLRIN